MLDVDILPELEGALRDGSLHLLYQPQVDLASGEVVAMEALLRWQHPSRGLLWPADFLRLAEAGGLIVRIGAWVLGHAAQELATWQRLPEVSSRREPHQLWVNVGHGELTGPGFVDFVGHLVADFALPRGVLGLEITEQTLSAVGSGAPALLHQLRAAGVALAVDDFGTWYSSLASLGDLPVDMVKLDHRFVRGVGSDFEDDSIVGSVIRLAHSRGLIVVAEGVESWAEGARLCELGCDRAHGFLFSSPQRPERARRMLLRGLGWPANPSSTGSSTGGKR